MLKMVNKCFKPAFYTALAIGAPSIITHT